MTFLTLKDVKDSRMIRKIAGMCSTTDDFLALVNEAVERLMTRGDWATTLIPIHVCIKRGCVTWPRYVGSVRDVNLCGSPIPVTGLYANYLDRDLWPRWYNWPGLIPYGQLGNYYNLYNKGFGSELRYTISGANKVGYYSTYNDPFGDDRFIRAYPQFPEDVGKTVTIFADDENGQPLVHDETLSDGTTVRRPGHVITIANPFGTSSVMINRPIERVIKDKTAGRVWLYAYDPTQDEGTDTATGLEDLAVYEPSETNPTYERMSIPGSRDTTAVSNCNNQTVMALIKLKFIEAEHDTDQITIPSLPALKTMMQAIQFEDANDAERATEWEARAIRELNLQLRDQYPPDQTPVAIEPFNATGIGPQMMF